MLKKIALFLVLTVLTLKVNAENVKFLVNGPNVAVIDSYFKIEFQINADSESFEGPNFGDLEVVAGPIKHESSSYSYVNGQSTSSKSVIYTYGIVAPKEGVFTIGSATAVVDGKEYKTNPLSIEIIKERQSSENATVKSSSGRSTTIKKDDIILRMFINKRSAYKGEPVIATLKIYDRTGSIVGFKDMKEPDFSGFWKQQLEIKDNVVGQETFNGKVYRTQELLKFLLFPQKSGEINLGSLELTAVARVVVESSQSQRRSMLDDFFGGGVSTQDIDYKLLSQNIKLDIKELPAGAPVEFDGAVGDFTVDYSMNPIEMSANSGGNVTVRISGEGNMPLINAPNILLSSMFEVYPSTVQENLNITSLGVRGFKEFTYPFIVRAEGEHEIKPFKFAYFNPTLEKYEVVSNQPFNIKVTRDLSNSSANRQSSVISSVAKEELKMLDNDIRFIYIGDEDFDMKHNFIISSIWYVLSLVLMFLIFVSSLIYLRKRIKEMLDTVRVKNRRANKVASKRLKAAAGYMANSKQNEFYQEMLSAMLGYVSDKLNIPVVELSKNNISNQLLNKGIEESIVTGLLAVISDCEMAQYSPMESSQMNVIYSNAVELIGSIENKI